mmetsp:Transcript_7477/g.23076  ORF Transcript_7477/g.23076 Transcript_7477/m.23076 type:complete len:113 (-) Transcript_7477:79-417(-)
MATEASLCPVTAARGDPSSHSCANSTSSLTSTHLHTRRSSGTKHSIRGERSGASSRGHGDSDDGSVMFETRPGSPLGMETENGLVKENDAGEEDGGGDESKREEGVAEDGVV